MYKKNMYLTNCICIQLFQISTLKNARALCSVITQKGSNLHELLAKELDARVCRKSISRNDRFFLL